MSRSAPSSSSCRIGFVGTGGVAQRHAAVLSGLDDVLVVGATDTEPTRTAEFVATHGGRAAADVAELLAFGVDAVYVCVPPFAHGEPERQVLDAGVALFVEKPLALDVATAEEIGRRVSAAGVVNRVGLHWRLAEPVRRARELLAGREVHLVSGSWLDRVPPVAWWTDRARSGGPLVEQAVHVIDTARLLVGEIDQVHAASAGRLAGGTEAASAALLRFTCGAAGTLTTAAVLPGQHRAGLEIVADGLVVEVGAAHLRVTDADGSRVEEFDPHAARVAVDRAFVDELRGRPVDPVHGPPDHAEALRSHRVACALARSVDTGVPQVVA